MKKLLVAVVLSLAACGGPDRRCLLGAGTPPLGPYEMDCACPMHYRDAAGGPMETVPITALAESCAAANAVCDARCQ